MNNILKKKLVIRLKSDLISGSGEGWGNVIDTDITYDQYGFPYIPARRIRGLLKEAACELEEFNVFEKNMSEILFGNNEKHGHHFVLYNALLENIKEMQNEIDHLIPEYKNYVHELSVLNHYTSVRYQTAIEEDGIAKENSLRSSRAINKDLVFYAQLECEEEDLEKIEKCIAMVHHMGINRTRGFGEVDLSLEDDQYQDESYCFEFIDDKEYEVKLYLENETQLSVVSTKGEKTLDYITGSSILGYFANNYLKRNELNDRFYELFVLGNVKFSNAYISDNEWNEYYPIKESIYKQKVGNIYYDKCVVENTGDEIISKVRNKYMSYKGVIKSVEKEMYYHHRRPQDKSIGHAVDNILENQGTFYQLEVMSSHQKFITTIRGLGKDLKDVLDGLSQYIQIGKSKFTQYGNIRVDHIDYQEVHEDIIPANTEVVCVLRSPLLLLDSKRESILDLDFLAETLNIENPQFFVSYNQIGGYNAKWKLQKPSYVGFGAGSCVKGILKQNTSVHMIVGNLVQEGLGQITFEKLDNVKNVRIQAYQYHKNINYQNPVYTKEIIVDVVKHYLHVEALDKMNKTSVHISSSLIGRVLLMLSHENWDVFMKDVRGIADKKKQREVLEVIETITNMCDQLIEDSHLKELTHEDYYHKFYLQTCKDYFTQQKIERREA